MKKLLRSTVSCGLVMTVFYTLNAFLTRSHYDVKQESLPSSIVRASQEKHLQPSNRSDSTTLKHCRVYDLSQPLVASYKCVDSSLTPSTKICLYDTNDDRWVSDTIEKTGMWEGDLVSMIQSLLREDPEAGLLDLGANIGVYTLSIAKMGRKVVAVEPNLESVHRIQKAAQLSGSTEFITLLNNGISDERSSFKIHFNRLNQGDTTIRKNCTGDCGHDIETIMLNDLLEVITFPKAIMKMDIQGFEHKAFTKAEELFNKVDITHIFLEWAEMKHYYGSSSDKTMVLNMIKMLEKRGFSPWTVKGDKLDLNQWDKWPGDMIWSTEPVTNSTGIAKSITSYLLCSLLFFLSCKIFRNLRKVKELKI